MDKPFETEPARRLRFTVSRDKIGLRLIDFLAARFDLFTEAQWRRKILDGAVLLNGETVPPDHALALRDRVEYLAWDIPEPDVDTGVTVVYREGGLLVVDKPAGLPCHPGGRYFHNTLTRVLCARHGLADPILVNRLDRETSGLVVVAADPATARGMQILFETRQIEKEYIAFVEGAFPDELTAEGTIVPDPDSPVRKRRLFVPRPAAPAGPCALTEFRRLGLCGPLSQVRAIPATGRQHQLRATLHAVGFPIVGDKLYGVDPSIFLRFCDRALTAEDRRRLRLDRLALHAAVLRFRHPGTGARIELEAPLPPELAALAHSEISPQTDKTC